MIPPPQENIKFIKNHSSNIFFFLWFIQVIEDVVCTTLKQIRFHFSLGDQAAAALAAVHRENR